MVKECDTVICYITHDWGGAAQFVEKARKKKKNIINLAEGTARVFEKIDPEELSECLVNWLSEELPERCVIAVDGKTIKGSAFRLPLHAYLLTAVLDV